MKKFLYGILIFTLIFGIAGCSNNSTSLNLSGVRDDFAKEMLKIYNELETASKKDNPSKIINKEYEDNYLINIFPKYLENANKKEKIILAQLSSMVMNLKNNHLDKYTENKNILINSLNTN